MRTTQYDSIVTIHGHAQPILVTPITKTKRNTNTGINWKEEEEEIILRMVLGGYPAGAPMAKLGNELLQLVDQLRDLVIRNAGCSPSSSSSSSMPWWPWTPPRHFLNWQAYIIKCLAGEETSGEELTCLALAVIYWVGFLRRRRRSVEWRYGQLYIYIYGME